MGLDNFCFHVEFKHRVRVIIDMGLDLFNIELLLLLIWGWI
jgi:hypothetical protein